MTTYHGYQYADEAPAGWERCGQDETLPNGDYSTWLAADGDRVLVPIKYAQCDYCEGTGDHPDYQDEFGTPAYAYCPECNGEGVDRNNPTFNFAWAISKTSVMRIKAIGVTDVAGLQWWNGGAK